MALTISDESLQALGMDEREAKIEIACRLFDAGKLTVNPAARLAGLTRYELEGELRRRNIAVYRPTVEDLAEDLEGDDDL